jgi:hypothetical protein
MIKKMAYSSPGQRKGHSEPDAAIGGQDDSIRRACFFRSVTRAEVDKFKDPGLTR